MAILLKALRSFQGDEGTVYRGDIFEVEDKERADRLKELELAEDAPAGAEVTNLDQKNSSLDDMTKAELEQLAKDEGVTYRDGATKDEIKQAIIDHREAEAQKEATDSTAVYGTNEAGEPVNDGGEPTEGGGQ